MQCTGSISKGKTAEKHNTRECYDAHNCPENIDLGRTGQNVVLCDRTLEDVYAECFGKAAEEYSAKQVAKGHPERAIPDYLAKVRADKQLKPMYEFVVQVGNRDEHPDAETCRKVLTEWVRDFNERFGSHFAMKQAVIHMDEETPHLHYEVVPVATSKRGLAVQNSLSKAIKQAGFSDYKSMLPAWDDILTECMERHGIDRVAGSEERSRGHMTVEQYKDYMAAEELLSAQREELGQARAETDRAREEASRWADAAAQAEYETGQAEARLEWVQGEEGRVGREVAELERAVETKAAEPSGHGLDGEHARAHTVGAEALGRAGKLAEECQAAVAGSLKGRSVPEVPVSRDREVAARTAVERLQAGIADLRERLAHCRDRLAGLVRRFGFVSVGMLANRGFAEEHAPRREAPSLDSVLADAVAASEFENRQRGYSAPTHRRGIGR